MARHHKKSAEDARARRVERTHDIAELPQRARAAVGVGETTEFIVHTSGEFTWVHYMYACISVLSALVVKAFMPG